ncbi:MAG: hypothetical protein NVSMB49_16570 [Ktedonobacteraceae bacterium]
MMESSFARFRQVYQISFFLATQPQLSLDVRTSKTLDAMQVNNSDLFETLLNQYEPFLDTWAEMGYGRFQEDEDE